MDVNKTIKANKLIKELTKHGVVSSVQDAFSKAQQIVNKEDKEKSEKIESSDAKVEKKESSFVGPEVDEMAKMDNKYRNLLKDFGQSVTKDLQQMKQEIFNLGKEINQLRNEMVMLKARPAPKRKKKLKKNQQRLNNSNSGGNKGSQGHQPGDKDIAVDKVFYFGQK